MATSPQNWFDTQPQPGGVYNPGPSYNPDGTLNTGGNQMAGTVNASGGTVGITDPGQTPPTATADPFPQQANKATASAAAGNPTTPIGPVQNGDYQGWFQNLTQGKPLDQAGLLALGPQLQAAGIQITPPSKGGVVSKIGIPDGNGGTTWVRVLNGDTNVASPTVWIPETGGAGSSGGVGADGLADGSLLQPWTGHFTPPDPSQIQQDQSYQFQLGQGLQGIQRSAAARGTLLTGGTLKGLDQFGQGLASTYNDKYYDRALQQYQMGQQDFYNNQDRPFSKLSALATLGKPAALPNPTPP